MAIELALQDEERITRIGSLLSCPMRLRLMSILASTPRTLSVQELAEKIELSQETTSHHLRLLRDAGFVEYEKPNNRGLYRYYYVHFDAVKEALRLVELILHLNESHD